MTEVGRFFRIYGIVFLIYMFFYVIIRFFTVVMLGSDWKFGILEWGFVGIFIIVFLQFFVTIAIPKSAVFLGELILGKNN